MSPVGPGLPGGGQSGQTPCRDGGLEVVAACIAVYVQHLTGTEEARHQPALQGLWIQLLKRNAASCDHRLIPAPERGDGVTIVEI